MSTILITSGGTQEPIDNIRSITNTGTGTLGSLIADCFAEDAGVEKILYVHGPGAVKPKTEKALCTQVGSVDELQAAVRRLIAEENPDAVIHSMAVSDYRVAAVIKQEDLVLCSGAENPAEEAKKHDLRDVFNKIPSSAGQPVIFLEPTPKVIPELRTLAPEAVIVGFKLLDGVSKDELFTVAKKLMEKNDCDLVLANDYETVKEGRHTGYLIERNGSFETFVGKPAIAMGIREKVRGMLK